MQSTIKYTEISQMPETSVVANFVEELREMHDEGSLSEISLMFT